MMKLARKTSASKTGKKETAAKPTAKKAGKKKKVEHLKSKSAPSEKTPPKPQAPVVSTPPVMGPLASALAGLRQKATLRPAPAVPLKSRDAFQTRPSKAQPQRPEVVKPAVIKKESEQPRQPSKPQGGASFEQQIVLPIQETRLPPKPKKLSLQTPLTVKSLAEKLSVKPNELIQKLIKMGVLATMNQTIGEEIVKKVSFDFGYEIEKEAPPIEKKIEAVRRVAQDSSGRLPRPPIVTFMGHVDHGKTSLLDAIRKTKVAAHESGSITQHIGAYEVFLKKGAVTFLDTPGHQAFTAMRARGAQATDIVVLVVAADDGVMPQTIEAIDHAKAAGVPIVVAINKIDLPSAVPDRVKKSLSELGLLPEDWGGKTITVGVSAKTGEGIDHLLEMLLLESDLLELKANPSIPAEGVVIEAKLSKESGSLVTVLVQEGTLKVGDILVIGQYFGRVRAMINDRSHRVKQALPSMPVEILGLSGVPMAGQRFQVVKDDRTAKELVETRLKGSEGQSRQHVTLERLYHQIQQGQIKDLKLILKADVQGSIEAIRNVLGKMDLKQVKLNIIHAATGDVNESDVMLAAASDAIVVGFHVSMMPEAEEVSRKEEVDVHFYKIIYDLQSNIEAAMQGLLEPEMEEVILGEAEVRQLFSFSKIGTIAGSFVTKGKIVRNASCRVIREGKKIHEGRITSLKRFKEDAREVQEKFECGLRVGGLDDLRVGDKVEAFEIRKSVKTVSPAKSSG